MRRSIYIYNKAANIFVGKYSSGGRRVALGSIFLDPTQPDQKSWTRPGIIAVSTVKLWLVFPR